MIQYDHGKIIRIPNATLELKSLKKAYALIRGIEIMHALRKGLAGCFILTSPRRTWSAPYSG